MLHADAVRHTAALSGRTPTKRVGEPIFPTTPLSEMHKWAVSEEIPD